MACFKINVILYVSLSCLSCLVLAKSVQKRDLTEGVEMPMKPSTASQKADVGIPNIPMNPNQAPTPENAGTNSGSVVGTDSANPSSTTNVVQANQGSESSLGAVDKAQVSDSVGAQTNSNNVPQTTQLNLGINADRQKLNPEGISATNIGLPDPYGDGNNNVKTENSNNYSTAKADEPSGTHASDGLANRPTTGLYASNRSSKSPTGSLNGENGWQPTRNSNVSNGPNFGQNGQQYNKDGNTLTGPPADGQNGWQQNENGVNGNPNEKVYGQNGVQDNGNGNSQTGMSSGQNGAQGGGNGLVQTGSNGQNGQQYNKDGNTLAGSVEQNGWQHNENGINSKPNEKVYGQNGVQDNGNGNSQTGLSNGQNGEQGGGNGIVQTGSNGQNGQQYNKDGNTPTGSVGQNGWQRNENGINGNPNEKVYGQNGEQNIGNGNSQTGLSNGQNGEQGGGNGLVQTGSNGQNGQQYNKDGNTLAGSVGQNGEQNIGNGNSQTGMSNGQNGAQGNGNLNYPEEPASENGNAMSGPSGQKNLSQSKDSGPPPPYGTLETADGRPKAPIGNTPDQKVPASQSVGDSSVLQVSSTSRTAEVHNVPGNENNKQGELGGFDSNDDYGNVEDTYPNEQDKEDDHDDDDYLYDEDLEKSQDQKNSDLVDQNPASNNQQSKQEIKSQVYINNGQNKQLYPGKDPEIESSGHFMAYFILLMVVVVVGYLFYHNRQKVLAFVIEGRHGRKGPRRPSSSEYKKLASNVDEALPSLGEKTSSQNIIY